MFAYTLKQIVTASGMLREMIFQRLLTESTHAMVLCKPFSKGVRDRQPSSVAAKVVSKMLTGTSTGRPGR